MTAKGFQKTISEYRLVIDRGLKSLIKDHDPAYLYEPVAYVFEGKGKRLRPILVLLVAKMFGSPELEALPAALAVELLHNFSLVHDDIMDRDNLRHGLPTVYRKWDESAAILAGDAIFALAHGQLLRIKGRPLDCIRVFNRATIGLCEGQAMDKEFESSATVTLEEYLNMVRLKTGTLLAASCRLGAIVSDAEKQEERALEEFGLLLGQAFQIQDDLLEIYSSDEEMGKSLGSDVITRKQTYLTCKAVEQDSQSWNELMESLEGKDMKSEVIPALRHYFEDTGVVGSAQAQVRDLIASGLSKLEMFGREGRKDLDHFVNMLLARKR
ncbi:MAG: polyprenyl synthetase family protein [Fidelibacterota bacterium]